MKKNQNDKCALWITGKCYKLFALAVLNIFSEGYAFSQDLLGDTIYVNSTAVITVVFPAPPTIARLTAPDGEEGFYQVRDLGETSLSILAIKNNGKVQRLEVVEGGRRHVFILSYNERIRAGSLDYSTKKKLSARVDKIQPMKNRIMADADNLYNRAKDSMTNRVLWHRVELAYDDFSNIAETNDTTMVNSRLSESRFKLQLIVKQMYTDAMTQGEKLYFNSAYPGAKNSFQEALSIKPGDSAVLRSLAIVDSAWLKSLIEEGDKAVQKKDYVLAKANYQQALKIKPGETMFQHKYMQARSAADVLLYNREKEKGDQALKEKRFREARTFYDSALSLRPGDSYIKTQLNSLRAEQSTTELEETAELEYQDLLLAARLLAEKAIDKKGVESAIREFKRASELFPKRKFPVKRINELMKRITDLQLK